MPQNDGRGDRCGSNKDNSCDAQTGAFSSFAMTKTAYGWQNFLCWNPCTIYTPGRKGHYSIFWFAKCVHLIRLPACLHLGKKDRVYIIYDRHTEREERWGLFLLRDLWHQGKKEREKTGPAAPMWNAHTNSSGPLTSLARSILENKHLLDEIIGTRNEVKFYNSIEVMDNQLFRGRKPKRLKKVITLKFCELCPSQRVQGQIGRRSVSMPFLPSFTYIRTTYYSERIYVY